MATEDSKKCVVIVDQDLPRGLAANAIACLAFSLGDAVSGAVAGPEADQDQVVHGGLINIPITVLATDKNNLAELVGRARTDQEITMFDMSDVAQAARTVEDYRATLSQTPNSALVYRAVALYGSKLQLRKLTGSYKLY